MSRRKNYVYVGGLEENVNEELLHAAFIPFGDLKSVQVVRDFTQNKSRGFGFVEFDLDEDAAEAVSNMDGSEIVGKVITCNVAKPPSSRPEAGKAIWTNEDFLQSAAQIDQ